MEYGRDKTLLNVGCIGDAGDATPEEPAAMDADSGEHRPPSAANSGERPLAVVEEAADPQMLLRLL
jgi:hypothetical protein